MNMKVGKQNKRFAGFRILAVFLAVLQVLVFLPALPETLQAASAQNPWDGETLEIPEVDETGTYRIRTGAELAWFAAEVNKGNGEINGRLENYIYLNSYNTSHRWIMIGDSEANPYRGHFDGNGQQIVYMRAEIRGDDPERRYAGLFGVIDGGTVENVTVLGKVIHGYGTYKDSGSTDQLYTGSGGIAGYLKSGQIINCTNYARTTMDGDTLYRNAGGIVGICSGMVIQCVNEGKLSTLVSMAQNHVGGIAGLVYGVDAQILNCMNNASVQGYFSVGGIAGGVKSGGEINYSCNFGTVRGSSRIGGIAGHVTTTGVYRNGTAKQCAIRNVYHLGSLGAYGTGSGTELGGIAGRVGYESWREEELPPMPVIQNAYSVSDFSYTNYGRRGAIIGYLLSGSYGRVYSVTSDSSLNVVGASSDRAVEILDEAMVVSEAEMKSVGMIEKLGSAFTMSNEYDTQNDGYPKLVWQGLPSELLAAVDRAQVELDQWLTEENVVKYGANYAQIESLVKEYKDALNAVTSQEELEGLMEAARESLNAVQPSQTADSELAEAVDNAVISLQEYRDRLAGQHEDLTEDWLKRLDSILTAYTEKLNGAATLEDVQLLTRDGRDSLDAEIADFEASKRLEEIRAEALESLDSYRADETYEDSWMLQIQWVRNAAREKIQQAETASEISSLLQQARQEIDAVIDQIPEAGAWDGKTLTEPALSAEGMYQITSGSELAWFANAVNTRPGGSGLSAELCNDISLGYQNWTPIGNGSQGFQGSFEGNGYAVRGLYVDLAETYAGLFGNLTGGGNQVIQNVTVSGSMSLSGRVGYAGGIAGYVSGDGADSRIRIVNCHNLVSITLEDMETMRGGTGGIAGYTANAELSGCSNQGNVEIASAGKGGILYYSGGIVGNADDNTLIQTSVNSGTIRSWHSAGGIIGGINGTNCYVYACYNTGEISAETNGGGLCGMIAERRSEFKWCYSSGPVNLDRSGWNLGALFGSITYSGSYENLYALKRSDSLDRALVGTSVDFSGAGRFLADSELRSDDTLNALNGGGSFFIPDYLEIRGGYPILSWEMTLEEFQNGAVSALQNSVQESDYEAENWAAVQNLIAAWSEQIQAAVSMAEVNTALAQAKEEIAQVETLRETQERRLQEARNEAITILENYVDLAAYRDEEQALIRQYVADAKKYILQSESMEEVERHLNEARENIDALPDAWQYYYQQDLAAAAQVDSYISNIGEVVYTAYVKTSIQIARAAYEGLTENQKGMVTAYQALLDAEAAWAALEAENEASEEDLNLAAEVDALIAAIGEVSLESEDAIRQARLAFDSLSEKQQALVAHPEALVAAENAYDSLRANQVASAIAAIGEVTLDKADAILAAQEAYDALTEKQKALVTDYGVLQNAMAVYQNLLVVQPVIELISDLKEAGDITLEDGDAILAAIRAYNDLTGDQQALVSNYDRLEEAAARYDFLAGVQLVMDQISGIGTVNPASGPLLASIREAYNSLTPDQQRLVTNLSVLENAEAAYQALQNPQLNPDSGTSPIPGGQTELQPDGPAEEAAPETEPETEPETSQGTGLTAPYGGSVSGGGGAGNAASAPEPELPETTGEGALLPETEEEPEIASEGTWPDWLDEAIEEENAGTEDTAAPADAEAKQRKTQILILAIILAACAALTLIFGVALQKSSVKRKEKKVYY